MPVRAVTAVAVRGARLVGVVASMAPGTERLGPNTCAQMLQSKLLWSGWGPPRRKDQGSCLCPCRQHGSPINRRCAFIKISPGASGRRLPKCTSKLTALAALGSFHYASSQEGFPQIYLYKGTNSRAEGRRQGHPKSAMYQKAHFLPNSCNSDDVVAAQYKSMASAVQVAPASIHILHWHS